ncbi:myosin light chain kinase A-like [Penaeus japonicus]|uniref:myosin light chain kinase A-like n=1 Tax=Penaeus japonicus TaxID=27405 RepID=UPI001C711F45|nr:myosin light chain kinase A-like [Penaeus japonicus]
MAPFLMTEQFMMTLINEGSSQLGQGASGSVYLVKHEGEMAALKVGKSKRQCESFTKEREVLEIVNGAGGSPRVLGYCPDTPALLMTYCTGQDLFEVAEQGAGDRECLSILVKTCQALQEVHQAGIVHCDLKPDNILVEMSEEGVAQEVHIIDFGLACSFGYAFLRRFNSNERPWYCPCFFDGTPMQAPCDVLALAVTISYFSEVMSGECRG